MDRRVGIDKHTDMALVTLSLSPVLTMGPDVFLSEERPLVFLMDSMSSSTGVDSFLSGFSSLSAACRDEDVRRDSR